MLPYAATNFTSPIPQSPAGQAPLRHATIPALSNLAFSAPYKQIIISAIHPNHSKKMHCDSAENAGFLCPEAL